MNTSAIARHLLSVLFVAAVAFAPAAAQTMHTIEVRDGVVRLDGKVLPEDEIPATLRQEGLTAQLTFSAGTLVGLGQSAFRVEDGHLIEVEKDIASFQLRSVDPAPLGGTYRIYGQALGDQAVRIQRLRDELETRDENRFIIAERLADEVEQTVAIVEAFPRVELKAYLEEVQSRDRSLYQGIVQEQLMEMESRKLASRLRSTPESGQRRTLRQSLEEQLTAMFELKQANRRAEIDQLSRRLEELSAQLETRERNRDVIIQNRIETLLAEPR